MIPILYTTVACPGCHRAKKWLDEHKIKYREVNLAEDWAATARLTSMGLMGAPVLEVNGDYILGFSPARYAKVFVEEVAR